MLLKDLPKELQKLAIKRIKEQNNEVIMHIRISKLFNWGETKEGAIFWLNIYDNNIKEARTFNCYPNKNSKKLIKIHK